MKPEEDVKKKERKAGKALNINFVQNTVHTLSFVGALEFLCRSLFIINGHSKRKE
jgi:hypothetical protein